MVRSSPRPLGPAGLLLLALAGCDGLAAVDGRTVSGPVPPSPRASVAAAEHTVVVQVTGSPVLDGLVVTVKNVDTGVYLPRLTDEAGRASFSLPDGRYLVHARNLADLGPLFRGVPLSLAPLPEGTGLLLTSTEELNNVGVLLDPGAPGTSIPLNPPNYERLTKDPPLVLAGGASDRTVSLAFGRGASIVCRLLDSDGSPVALQSSENVFLIFPFRDGADIPPPAPEFTDSDLPPALLFTAAFMQRTQTGCDFSGVPSTEGYTAILETNPVVVDGEAKVFLQQFTVTDEQAAAGETVTVPLVAEPRRATIEYIREPLGDARGATDIGVVSYGWGVTDGAVDDRFIVGARFRGAGVYSVYLVWGRNRAKVDVRCDAAGCRLARKSPTSLSVSVSGLMDGALGNLVVELALPRVETLDFRMLTGSPGADDYAPDSGLQRAVRPGELENTWIISWDDD